MRIQALLTGVLLAGVAVPAMAQTSFFIVQDSSTKRCQIVDQRPATKEMVIVDPDGVTYKTRMEAEDAMKTVKVCHP